MHSVLPHRLELPRMPQTHCVPRIVLSWEDDRWTNAACAGKHRGVALGGCGVDSLAHLLQIYGVYCSAVQDRSP